MKKIIFALIAMTATTGLAQTKSNCEKGMKQVYDCAATPQKDDAEIVGSVVARLEICQKGSTTYMVIQSDTNEVSPVAPVTPSMRTGATVYPLESFGEIAIGSRPYPGNKHMARFYVFMPKDEPVSSTMTCLRK